MTFWCVRVYVCGHVSVAATTLAFVLEAQENSEHGCHVCALCGCDGRQW